MKSQFGIIIILLLFYHQAYSCPTKVSEWTLLNFIPLSYQLLYFTNVEPEPSIVQKHEKIEPVIEKANIQFHAINISRLKSEHERAVFAWISGKNLPVYALYYQNRLFAQFNDLTDITRLIESPLRTSIANELKSGKLCVLLYLKCGDVAQDQPVANALEETLSKSILKDIIPVIHLSRDNPDEHRFIQLLLKVEPDLEILPQPMLFGIFGRFRVLEPLVGKGITQENINYLIQFLSADCSCLIKDQMPGIDMLYLNQWEDVKPALLNAIIDQ